MKPLASELAKVGFRYLGVPYSTIDCQAFVEKCLEDIGIKKNLAGSNAWFRTMTWVGSPEVCVAQFGEIPPGAFLFILKHDNGEPEKYKKDGIGNASHIGIYTAIEDGAIHSSASKGCVCQSKFSGKSISGGWNMVGLWDEINYGDGFWEKEGEHQMQYAKVYGGNINYPINVRKTPNGNLLGKIPQNAVVAVFEMKDGFIKVQYNAIEGWVKAEFVHLEDDASGLDNVITVSRQDLLDIYTKVGNLLGIHG